MAVFFCDTYPDITIYVPAADYYAKFRRGRFDTESAPEEVREAVYEQLSSATECYEDDGSLPCGWNGCGARFPSERGRDAHYRTVHGGPPPGGPVIDLRDVPKVQATRGVRRAVAE